MNTPSVTITILAYRSKETIQQCIASALALIYEGQIDIRILEQGEDAEEFRIIQDSLPPGGIMKNRSVFLTRGENIGFAAGHNALIRESDTDFILCLNADAVLLQDFLLSAMPPFHDPSVGAVQGKVLRWKNGGRPLPTIRYGLPPAVDDEQESIIDTTGLLPLRNRRIINRGQGEIDSEKFNVQGEIFGPDGAVPLYRRAALNDVAVPLGKQKEYFDESFFTYKEDVDLAWRLQWRGWKTVYVPKAVAWHGRGSGDSAAHTPLRIIAERRKISPKAKYYSFANQRLMQIKNESVSALSRDFFPWAVKECGAWLFALLSEAGTVPALLRILRLLPSALRKRSWIMAHRKSDANPYHWFT